MVGTRRGQRRRPDPRTGRAAPAPGWQGDRYRCVHRSGSVKGLGIVALRIGYKASAEQFGPRDLVEYAVQAEQVGLDSAVVSDHFLPWRHEGGHAPFALSWLAAVGERTSRIQLGTSVLTPTFRYNPAVLAQEFATLGLLYPGRVMLGVGTGEALNEVAVSGREWPEFKERFARLREAVRLMRELWTGEDVSFDGDYYTTVGATIYDKPEQPVPVYIAAGGPVVAKYAGRAGDGFICTSGKGMELYTEKLLPAVAEGAAAAERDPSTVDRMIEIKMSYDRDTAAALERVASGRRCRSPPSRSTASTRPWRWNASPTRSPSSRWRRGGSSPPTLTTRSPRSRRTSTPGSTTWCSTGPATTRGGSSPSSPRTCSRSCAPWAEPGQPRWRAFAVARSFALPIASTSWSLVIDERPGTSRCFASS